MRRKNIWLSINVEDYEFDVLVDFDENDYYDRTEYGLPLIGQIRIKEIIPKQINAFEEAIEEAAIDYLSELK